MDDEQKQTVRGDGEKPITIPPRIFAIAKILLEKIEG